MPAYRRDVSLIVTNKEVKTTLFSIPSHRSLGQIGMGVDFLKICWHIVGEGTLGFYTYGRLPKSWSRTLITLVPEVANPIYSYILLIRGNSKMLCARLKIMLSLIVKEHQYAFIEGRLI